MQKHIKPVNGRLNATASPSPQPHIIQFEIHAIRFYRNEILFAVCVESFPTINSNPWLFLVPLGANEFKSALKTVVRLKTNYQAIDCIYLNYCLITANKNSHSS